MRKGFSFAEVLVSMVIIGTIATLTLPIVARTLNKEHKQLYKTAVDNLNTIVTTLSNNSTLYPLGEFTSGQQFCTDFAANVNTIGAAACTTNPTIPGTPNIVTTNGMKWYFDSVTTNDFTTACPDGAGSTCMLVYVDINGGKGKNTNNITNPDLTDILKIYVSKKGKLYIPETSAGPERDYLTD